MSQAKQSSGERGFLRGLQTYGDRDFSIYMRRAFAKSMGYTGDELQRPVVGIAYTHSRFNPCHRHFPELLEAVKRGVAASGGLALEFPTISLHESTLSPNSMKRRPIESDKRATSDNGGLAATGQLRWSRLSCVPSECMKSGLRQRSNQSLYGLPRKR